MTTKSTMDGVADELLAVIKAATQEAAGHVATSRADADKARQILTRMSSEAEQLAKARLEAIGRLELAVVEAAKERGHELAASLATSAADLFGQRLNVMADEAQRLLAVDAGVRAERGMARRKQIWMLGTLGLGLCAILTWGYVNKTEAEANRIAASAESGKVSAAQLSAFGASVVVGPNGVYLLAPRGLEQATCGTAGAIPCVRLH